MKRIVQPEILDTLSPADPLAIHSRRDLRRVNSWMRNHVTMADALQNVLNHQAPGQITELGAGDGNFLLRVAQKLSPAWPNVTTTLVDWQQNVAAETLVAFAGLGWRTHTLEADVFDWLQTRTVSEVIITNLFLHHFEDGRLQEMLRLSDPDNRDSGLGHIFCHLQCSIARSK